MRTKFMATALVAAFSTIATAAGLVLNAAAGPHMTGLFPGPSVVFAALAAPVGVFLLVRQQGTLMARLLMVSGSSLSLYVLAMGACAYGLEQAAVGQQVPGWWIPWAVWMSSWLWLGALPIIGFLPQVFPTGRLLPGRGWRLCLYLTAVLAAILLVLGATIPNTTEFPNVVHPFLNVAGDGAELSNATAWVALFASLVFTVVALSSIISRFRRSHGAERSRIALVALALVVLNVASVSNSSWFQLVCALFLLVSLVLSVTKFGLFGTPLPQWGTTAGNRALLSAVENIAHHAPTPAVALSDSLGLVNNALRAATLSILPVAAAAPSTTSDAGHAPLVLPLTWARQPLGTLSLEAQPGHRLSARDVRTVTALQPSFSLLVREAALSAELESARYAVVNEREEERRRLRRDLHDGLGPLLAGAALSLGVAATKLSAPTPEENTAHIRSLVEDVAADLRQAVAAVRELSYGLRPPALDDAGLLAAISRLPVDPAVVLSVRAVGSLADVPAAVEVVAYRIAAEALRNVSRHAHAGRVDVVLHRSDGQLTVLVSDDGVGPGGNVGVGVLSMAEFAAEVGGRCQLRAGTPQGTVVEAALPLASAPLDQVASHG